MALSRTLICVSYLSTFGTQSYTFDIVMNSAGVTSVRNIVTPYGLLQDTNNSIPEDVLADIDTAIHQVEALVAQTSAVNGDLVFDGDTTQSYDFPIAMASTDYRVVYSTPDFVGVRTLTKTVDGFVAETSCTYTGTIGFDVFI
jgi:hypothetical protein